MTHLTTCVDAEAVARRAAAEIARHLQRARQERSVAHVALSGGTSPTRTYELLAGEPADWTGAEVWFADERCVPPEHVQSNYRLVAETLLGPAGIPPEGIHRMRGELGPDEGARHYAAALRTHIAPDRSSPPSRAARSAGSERAVGGIAAGRSARGLPVLDLVVLGVGPDGHVASLFPGAASLDPDERAPCIGVWDSPKPPPQRITLSLAVLRVARACLLLASGAGKADAINAMLAEPSRHVPASLLRRERLTVIVDDAASPAPVQR